MNPDPEETLASARAVGMGPFITKGMRPRYTVDGKLICITTDAIWDELQREVAKRRASPPPPDPPGFFHGIPILGIDTQRE